MYFSNRDLLAEPAGCWTGQLAKQTPALGAVAQVVWMMWIHCGIVPASFTETTGDFPGTFSRNVLYLHDRKIKFPVVKLDYYLRAD